MVLRWPGARGMASARLIDRHVSSNETRCGAGRESVSLAANACAAAREQEPNGPVAVLYRSAKRSDATICL